MNEAERSAVVTESTRRMHAGLEAMADAEWPIALGHFDKAVGLRETLPWREDLESAWMLAAAWINRGDVLRRLADGESRGVEAVVSYDRAIEAMGFVALADAPVIVERLILAWINRGTASGENGDYEMALAAFSEAGNLIEKWGADVTPERRFMAAMLRINRALTWLGKGQASEAWVDVRKGVEILSGLEKHGPVGSARIKARSVQCRVLASLLDTPNGAAMAGDWIEEATDAAEEALALVRETGFEDHWVSNLVRYGARIYQACQPQFLGEFLTEWIGNGGPLHGDDLLRKEMILMLLEARLETERKVLLFPQDTDFVVVQIKILKSLQAAEAALGLENQAGRA